MVENRKYILDPLYGVIKLPQFVWDILFVPEVQRLRELRLCNINSLSLTGAANINRYEHSIGTCYLAVKWAEVNCQDESEKERMIIVLAALLHDVYNSAFGHSIEYVEGFKGEDVFSMVALKSREYKYKHAALEPIYFGAREELSLILENDFGFDVDDFMKLSEYIQGRGKYGVLISGTMDLDNLDNVVRLAYHMGLTYSKDIPLKISMSIGVRGGDLIIDSNCDAYIEEWLSIRERLYKFLLLNPDEFSGKYMLTEAIGISKSKLLLPFVWFDTDEKLLSKLMKVSSEVAKIISNLMLGRLYYCLCICVTDNLDAYGMLSEQVNRVRLEDEINKLLRSEVEEIVDDFKDEEVVAIRGIKGIYYDSLTRMLRINSDLKINTANKLLDTKLISRAECVHRMMRNVNVKISRYKIKNPIIGIHAILDYGKTMRCVECKDAAGLGRQIGRISKRIYIGVFIKNNDFINYEIRKKKGISEKNIENIRHDVRQYLGLKLSDSNMSEIELYQEKTYV